MATLDALASKYISGLRTFQSFMNTCAVIDGNVLLHARAHQVKSQYEYMVARKRRIAL
jgi:hypothetical protein